MNPVKIVLSEQIIVKVIVSYIDDKINKLSNPDRFTKFDSDNDVFLGMLGEYAFAKFLYEKGFEKDKDYLKIDPANPERNPEDFILIDNKYYDKYDFKLNLLYNQDGSPATPIKIDVKTQKYTNQYTEDWQFAVNSNTIDKIEKGTREIDKFVFVFSRLGIGEVCRTFPNTIEELKEARKTPKDFIKNKEIVMEILGSIDINKFIFLSSKYEENEGFRIFSTDNSLKTFDTTSKMHRVNLKYLDNVNKTFPSLVLENNTMKNVDEDMLLDLIALMEDRAKNNPETKYFRSHTGSKTTANQFSLPYSKLYLDSMYPNFETFLQNSTRPKIKTKSTNNEQ